MPCIDLNTVAPAELQHHLSTRSNIVACLCAAWCDVCKIYRPRFEELALRHPEILFIWIDIEDQAGLVGDLDIDNFPTLLLQQGDVVSFYGTMQPETMQLARLIQSQERLSADQLHELSQSGPQQRSWQELANLRARIAQHV